MGKRETTALQVRQVHSDNPPERSLHAAQQGFDRFLARLLAVKHAIARNWRHRIKIDLRCPQILSGLCASRTQPLQGFADQAA